MALSPWAAAAPGDFCPVGSRGARPASVPEFPGAEARPHACVFVSRLANWIPTWCWTSCAATGFSRASASAARASPTVWSSRSSGRGEPGLQPPLLAQGPPARELFPQPRRAEVWPAPHTSSLCSSPYVRGVSPASITDMEVILLAFTPRDCRA